MFGNSTRVRQTDERYKVSTAYEKIGCLENLSVLSSVVRVYRHTMDSCKRFDNLVARLHEF